MTWLCSSCCLPQLAGAVTCPQAHEGRTRVGSWPNQNDGAGQSSAPCVTLRWSRRSASGWADAGRRRGERCGHCRQGGRRGRRKRPVEHGLHQACEAAAMPDDGDCSSRHSGCRGVMPRSRQMSAMTAPIGRRRTQAATCSDVGRGARPASRAGRAAGGCAAGRGRGTGRSRGNVQTFGTLNDPCFESAGQMQTAGDAAEDQRKIVATEGAPGKNRVAGDALADRVGEFLAVIDEFADQVEQAARAAGSVRAGRWGIGYGG